MDNTGIGYNSAQIGELAQKMESALSALKTSMEENWPTMVTTFRNNWVGTDEIAFETTFSNDLKIVYRNCDEIIAGATRFVCEAGKTWQEWQTDVANQLGGSQTSGQVYEHIRTSQEVNLNVSAMSADAGQFAGLTTAGAENNLIAAIDDYVNKVLVSFNGINETIDASKAFVGQEQSTAMNEFIAGLSENVRQIFSDVDNFKTVTIPDLVKAYNSQQSTIASAASTASSNIADAISSSN